MVAEGFDDFTIGIGGGDFAFDFFGVEGAFVFQKIELFGAGGAIDNADLFAFLEENALEADVGSDFDDVVID